MSQIIFNLPIALVLLAGVVYATTSENANKEVDRIDAAQSTTTHSTTSELSSLPSNLLSLLANGGTVVAGLLALAAVAVLVMPLFGFRMCSILGGCDPYQGYYNNDAYNTGAYGQTPLYTPSTYQKRSLEYIGPILKALSSAYDKYGKPAVTSTSVKKS